MPPKPTLAISLSLFAGALVFGICMYFATPEVRASAITWLIGANGLLFSALTGYLRSPRDARAADATSPETPSARRRTSPPPLPPSALVLGLAMLAASATGCVKAQTIAQATASTSAMALIELDDEYDDHYTEHADEALEASPDRATYEAAIAPWNALEEGVRSARSWLLSLQHSLDAWEQGGEHDFDELGACLNASLIQILAALEAAHATAPRRLTRAASMTSRFVGECERPPSTPATAGGDS